MRAQLILVIVVLLVANLSFAAKAGAELKNTRYNRQVSLQISFFCSFKSIMGVNAADEKILFQYKMQNAARSCLFNASFLAADAYTIM
jgi:hypothetical protein